MPYNLPGGPTWTASNFTNALEIGVANFAGLQGITNQTGWAAFIASLTQAQTIACMKKILETVTCSAP